MRCRRPIDGHARNDTIALRLISSYIVQNCPTGQIIVVEIFQENCATRVVRRNGNDQDVPGVDKRTFCYLVSTRVVVGYFRKQRVTALRHDIQWIMSSTLNCRRAPRRKDVVEGRPTVRIRRRLLTEKTKI